MKTGPAGAKMTWKRAMKIERIARLSLDPAGYTIAQIANHMGIATHTVAMIRQMPAYHAKMLELSTGILSIHDADLRQDIDSMRAELKSMVPSAIMVIRDAVLNKRNPALQFKAAQEIMDREGPLAKVRKSSVQLETKPNTQVDPNVMGNLMSLLASAPRSGDGGLTAAATGGFTMNAEAATKQQITMAEENTTKSLEELDLSNSKPN
jgi:transposase-like protein